MMDIGKAIKARHSVRQYLDKAITGEVEMRLRQEIDRCNREGGLNIQLVLGNAEAFSGIMARYGRFSGVSNYLALVGPRSKKLAETVGYYGEQLVLLAQRLGLNSCWVAGTYSKKKCAVTVKAGEKMVCVIALGFGATAGVPRKSKDMAQLHDVSGNLPDWFKAGMEAAMLAPTAINQQQFKVSLVGEEIHIKATGGIHSGIDLGIVKYHLEVATGRVVVSG
ncbi:MAG: nitroreductase [Lachnospiraceae bacterium]|nr:nitroreductase [Lachnospiraceae bacterium]